MWYSLKKSDQLRTSQAGWGCLWIKQNEHLYWIFVYFAKNYWGPKCNWLEHWEKFSGPPLWCSISMFQMLCKDWLKRLKWTPRWVLQFISTGWRLKPKRHACRATQTKGATVGARGATITTRAAGVTTKTEETTTTTTTGTGAPQLKQKGHQ